jgi:S1-C subfamily serine protease
VVGSGNEDLAEATVQIYALVISGDQWEVVWTGSGSVISSDGFILTNAHVVDDRYGEYDNLGVAMTFQTDQPPQFLYLAEIKAVDYSLDLSVIQIVSDLDGNSVALDLPFIPLGNSDLIGIGADLRILGYPGIGGDTITFTNGAVSGFTLESGIDGRAWIKTDATIAGGNSGGMAANLAGELVGVPTRASGSDDGQIVDCRPVVDTNRDGAIDENDSCVPIGGFINGLRPINLAVPLIDAAFNERQYAGGTDPSTIPSGGFDISMVDLNYLEFSDGVTEDDQPTQLWYAVPSGVTELCAFWDYEGMVDGMIWSAIWFVNGELHENGSFLETVWQGGSAGSWWVCIINEDGLNDGTYELTIEVGGKSQINDTVFVGGNRSVVDFTVVNESSFTLCFVKLSPSTASNWGQDELGPTEVIDSGFERPITIATGFYDLLLLDCDGEILLEDYELEVFEDLVYTVEN